MNTEPDQQCDWLRGHAPKLVLFARQWVHCHADAEDVVHDAFVRFWQARERARDPVAYLYRGVRNAALNWNRDNRRRTEREHAAEPDQWFEPTDALAESERNAAVESAVQSLTPDRREVVSMRIWGELTFAQIGEVLGISPSTADSRYRLALADLQTQLKELA